MRENPRMTPSDIVDQAITSRFSCRAFTAQEVPRDMLTGILNVARQAASGTNTQPWKVYVLRGEAKAGLVAKACAAHDAIYANPDATEEEYMHAAELESQFAELNGYSAEARVGELLLGVGIPSSQHHELMSTIAPGFKLRVLLAQALFSDPEILLLDEPTNNLDIKTIRWLEDVINASFKIGDPVNIGAGVQR